MSIENVLYRAEATSTGGREGTSCSSDGMLDVELTTSKELGGNGLPGTNPEQLFAAGYSACFLGALKFVAAAAKATLPAETKIRSVAALKRRVASMRLALAPIHNPAEILPCSIWFLRRKAITFRPFG